MANYANVGFIDDDQDEIYVRRDDYTTAGDLGTHDTTTGDFAILPVGAAGQVLTADPISQFGISWQNPSGENISAGAPAAQSGGSRLTIVDTGNNTTLAVALTGVVAGTYGDAGNVPQLTVSNTGQITAAVAVPIVANIVAGVSGAESGASGLTIVGNAVAAANSGVVAATYGNATNVSQITVDARGRITAAAAVPIVFPPAADQLASVATRNWGAGSGRVIGTQDNVAVGNNAAINGQEAVSIGSDSAARTLGVSVGHECQATQANCTGVGALIRMQGANSVFVGNNISAATQGIAATGNVAVGSNLLGALTTGQNNIVLGNGPASLLTTGSNNILAGLNAGANLTTSPSNIFIGQNTGLNVISGTGQSIAIGFGASPATSVCSNCISIGTNATAITESAALGFNCQANGVRSIVAGFASSAGGTRGIAIGNSASAGAVNDACAIGTNITNNLANSALIGNGADPLNYIVRSSGYFRSARTLSGCAGQQAGDILQIFAPAGPSPTAFTTVNLLSTRFDFFPTDGLSNIDLGAERLWLGNFPQDTGGVFVIHANLEGTADNNAAWRLIIRWTSPGVIAAANIGGVKSEMVAGEVSNLCISTLVSVPPATTGRNFVDFAVQRVSGAGGGTFTTQNFRCCVAKIA